LLPVEKREAVPKIIAYAVIHAKKTDAFYTVLNQKPLALKRNKSCQPQQKFEGT
jgi:hypothetical protein